jgi:secreted trypsin-like serine protease
MKAEIKQVDRDTCEKISYKNQNIRNELPSGITDEIMCALPFTGNTCEGDSGSGVSSKQSGIHYIHAITAFGFNCHFEYNISYYTRLTPKYIKWIEKIVF